MNIQLFKWIFNYSNEYSIIQMNIQLFKFEYNMYEY